MDAFDALMIHIKGAYFTLRLYNSDTDNEFLF